MSVRVRARSFNLSSLTLHRMLKELKVHPYKPRLLYMYELADKNFAHRMAFCEERKERLDDDPDFMNQVIFTTKRIFIFPAMLTGTIALLDG